MFCVDIVVYETYSKTSLSIHNVILKYTVDVSILEEYTRLQVFITQKTGIQNFTALRMSNVCRRRV
jgi:hypothetical protein